MNQRRKFMRRKIIESRLLLLLVLLLSSCSGKQAKGDMISVTIEPQRYFVDKIAGDKFVVNAVVPSGQSPETYDPTPQEMVRLGQSFAYFKIGYIGFEQSWMPKIQENNPRMKVFDLSQGMDVIREEAEHHHSEDEPEGIAAHHHHPGGVDPHIWSSVQGAKTIARNTFEALVSLEPEQETSFRSNYEKLLAEIKETEAAIHSLLEPVKGQAFIIYHPALTYFAKENGLIQLCIEMDGKEPSPGQLKELVQTAKEAKARVVFIQKEFDRKNAELIAKETGCRLVQINPLSYDWKGEMMHIAKALASDGKVD